MIYSKFTKTWIESCYLCNVALIDKEKLFRNINYQKWDVQFLKKYCIIEKKHFKNQSVGYCLNPRCNNFVANI